MIGRLRQRTHWVFDLDGSLIVSQHEVDAMRRELGASRGGALLSGLAS